MLTDDDAQQYHQRGFLLARGFYDVEEIELLRRSAKEDHELDQRSFGRADGEGGVVRLSLWNQPGDGLTPPPEPAPRGKAKARNE